MTPKFAKLLQSAIEEIQENRLESANNRLLEALLVEKNHPEALRYLGIVAAFNHEWNKALEFIDLSIQINPNNDLSHSNRGNILKELGRHEEALSSYEEALLINPDDIHTLCNAAQIFNFLHKYGHSIACSERAVELRPDSMEGWQEVGTTYFLVKDYEKAVAAYEQILKLNPNHLGALLSKGDIYLEDKRFDLAYQTLERAYQIDPEIMFIFGTLLQTALQMCNWNNLSNEVDQLLRGIGEGRRVALPYNVITLLDDPLLIRKAIEIYAHSIQQDIQRALPLKAVEHKKIRLGYFSADFHNHPTAYLMAELFECHNKIQFEIIGFAFGRNQPDEMRMRLEKSFDQFINVDHLTDQEIAALSREMEIDIAIDLKGFTQEGRPQIFMYGAAPIQVSYLAFPGTMGLSCFDYVVADPILIPLEAQDGMVEKIIYMPNSYQANDRHRVISKNQKTRDDFCLPSAGFVFCCFNNNYKITPTVFDGWIRILNAVEGSVLWLFGDNPYAIENLKKEAQARGLDSARLLFAERLEPADHLARYELADLFLDTTPCNAHTTASDALWAGLPVITLVGESFAARVAASLLSAVGVPDLITYTQEEYEQKAISLAKNPHELSAIKDRLLVNRFTTPLFHTPLFTKHIEQGYLMAYERYQAGLLPDHLYIV